MLSPSILDENANFFIASIVNSMQDSVVTINLEGFVTSWNRSAEKLYGYPAEEAIGQSLQLVLKPEDFKPLLEKVESIRNGLVEPVYDTFRICKDGRFINLEVTLSPITGRDGRVIGVSTLARDVTAARQAEVALAASENHLRAIVESALDFAIITLDGKGIITNWSSGAERMFGHDSLEVIGKHTRLIFTPEDRHGDMAQVEIETAKNTGRSIDERWHLHKDGSRFFMSGVMTPVKNDPAGSLVKVARNITDRKLAEEALMLSEQRNSLAVHSAGMGDWDWDLETGNASLSSQTRSLLGIATENQPEQANLILASVYPPDQQLVQQELEKALSGLFIFQADFRIVRGDNGQIKWVNVYGRVVAHKDDRPSRMIGVIYDITSRKQLEKQKDDFISLASHELKTPVTAIKICSELLDQSFEVDDKKRSLLQKLNIQVDRLTRLIQVLLDSSNLSDGKIQIHPSPVDLSVLINEQVQAMLPVTSSHNIICKMAPVGMVHADGQRVTQVLSNLISNAVKYAPSGSEIIISLLDELEGAKVTVQDFGPGIPTEAQAFLFERYYRVPGEISKRKEGFGLGLFISSEIIKQHHGTIGVDSTIGQGSTFYFSLPYS